MESPAVVYSVAKGRLTDRFPAEDTAGVRVILVYEQHSLVTLHDSLISLAASNLQ